MSRTFKIPGRSCLGRALTLAMAFAAGVAHAGTFGVLYHFKGGSDGSEPDPKMVLDSAGNLYGTTYQGGAKGYGTVFRLAPGGTETVLYSFKRECSDRLSVAVCK